MDFNTFRQNDSPNPAVGTRFRRWEQVVETPFALIYTGQSVPGYPEVWDSSMIGNEHGNGNGNGNETNAAHETHSQQMPFGLETHAYVPENRVSKTTTARKPGRPRGSVSVIPSKDSKDRRRVQVRMAQRAYRARNVANVTSLKNRITQLDTALEQMCEAVESLSDNLIRSRVLTSYPHVAQHLRDTVEKCLALAKGATDEGREDDDENRQKDPTKSPSNPSSMASSYSDKSNSLPSPLTSDVSFNYSSLFPFGIDNLTMVQIPAFIEHLRIACLYQGYALLKNPASRLDTLRGPFRLLLSFMKKETIMTLLKNSLHSRLNLKKPYIPKDMPSFQIGGSGTHYPATSGSEGTSKQQESQQHQEETIFNTPSPTDSRESQEEMGGDWFDMQDLEGFLKEKKVLLSMAPPVGDLSGCPSRIVVNAVDFTAELVNKATCLGHSPGFKRTDVETALVLCFWK